MPQATGTGYNNQTHLSVRGTTNKNVGLTPAECNDFDSSYDIRFA